MNADLVPTQTIPAAITIVSTKRRNLVLRCQFGDKKLILCKKNGAAPKEPLQADNNKSCKTQNMEESGYQDGITTNLVSLSSEIISVMFNYCHGDGNPHILGALAGIGRLSMICGRMLSFQTQELNWLLLDAAAKSFMLSSHLFRSPGSRPNRIMI